MQHIAIHCITLQHAATRCNTLHAHEKPYRVCAFFAATYCNALQHAATHCNTLEMPYQFCAVFTAQGNTMQHTATYCKHTTLSSSRCFCCNILQRTATRCNTIHTHKATLCSTLRRTANTRPYQVCALSARLSTQQHRVSHHTARTQRSSFFASPAAAHIVPSAHLRQRIASSTHEDTYIDCVNT